VLGAAYNDSVQAARNAACVRGRYNEQPDDSVPNYPKRACRFERSLLGPCAGLAPADDYGYGAGQPCVLLKVNRVSWEALGGTGSTGSTGMAPAVVQSTRIHCFAWYWDALGWTGRH